MDSNNNNKEVELAKLEKQLEALCENKRQNQELINDVEKRLTSLLCPKGKNECDPAYCTFRTNDNCEFLKICSFSKKE